MSRVVFVTVMLALGCTANSNGKDPAAERAEDGKADGFLTPKEHGAFGFASGSGDTLATLTSEEQFHAWDFSVHTAATVSFETRLAGADAPELDTILYFYKKQSDGLWGPYIARNDDSNDSLWSSLEEELEPGEYRVLVRGYSASELGDFTLQGSCPDGACAAVAPRCSGGEIVDGEPRFIAATDGLECQMPTTHCVTNNRSACPLLSPRPRDWCAEGTIVPTTPRFVSSSDGMECEIPSSHCVTRNRSACPYLTPRPRGWCAEGTAVNAGSRFIASSDFGMECEIPIVHCVTRDSLACPLR